MPCVAYGLVAVKSDGEVSTVCYEMAETASISRLHFANITWPTLGWKWAEEKGIKMDKTEEIREFKTFCLLSRKEYIFKGQRSSFFIMNQIITPLWLHWYYFFKMSIWSRDYNEYYDSSITQFYSMWISDTDGKITLTHTTTDLSKIK